MSPEQLPVPADKQTQTGQNALYTRFHIEEWRKYG